jgi:hypothetical protein
MFQDNTSLAAMAEALSRSTDHRVLRRLVPRTTFTPSVGESTKTGILLDTETTVDPRRDEVIELGMVKFDYLPDGRVVGVRGVFSSFNEPCIPIPTEVTALNGITDEMVAGQRIDEAAVSAFVEDAVIVIAHCQCVLPFTRAGLVALLTAVPVNQTVIIRLRALPSEIRLPPFPFTPGLEAAGEVIETGDGVPSLRTGERVLAVLRNGGGYAEEIVLDAATVLPIPETMDFVTAAAFPVAYGTSHFALTHRGLG